MEDRKDSRRSISHSMSAAAAFDEDASTDADALIIACERVREKERETVGCQSTQQAPVKRESTKTHIAIQRTSVHLTCPMASESLTLNATCTCMTGLLFDLTGSYDDSFFVAGSLIAVSGIMCLPLKRLSEWETNRSIRRRHDRLSV